MRIAANDVVLFAIRILVGLLAFGSWLDAFDSLASASSIPPSFKVFGFSTLAIFPDLHLSAAKGSSSPCLRASVVGFAFPIRVDPRSSAVRCCSCFSDYQITRDARSPGLLPLRPFASSAVNGL